MKKLIIIVSLLVMSANALEVKKAKLPPINGGSIYKNGTWVEK